MPLLRPRKKEKRDSFVSRFMGNGRMKKEFPKNKQRVAVAYSQWRKKRVSR